MATMVISTETAPVVSGPPQGRWTYADWEALPDDGQRYEVINGVLYMTTAPHSFHQWIIHALAEYLGAPAKRQGLAFPFAAPIGVIMPDCDPVQPDYVVVLKSKAHLFQGGRIIGVPDLIIEVLTPSNALYDQEIKLNAYARAGVPEYAIIDPRSRTLYHYRLSGFEQYAEPNIVNEAGNLTFDCLPTITLQLADLFAGAPDTSYDD